MLLSFFLFSTFMENEIYGILKEKYVPGKHKENWYKVCNHIFYGESLPIEIKKKYLDLIILLNKENRDNIPKLMGIRGDISGFVDTNDFNNITLWGNLSGSMAGAAGAIASGVISVLNKIPHPETYLLTFSLAMFTIYHLLLPLLGEASVEYNPKDGVTNSEYSKISNTNISLGELLATARLNSMVSSYEKGIDKIGKKVKSLLERID